MIRATVLRSALHSLLIASVAVSVLYWLADSETFLRLAAGLAEALSGGSLKLSGVQGAFLGPVRIDALDLATKKKRIEIRGVQFDWSPRALWHGRLQIDRLALAQLRLVELKPDTEPLTLPASLALPLDIEIPRASLQRLEIQSQANTLAFTDIGLALAKPAGIYRLTVDNVTTPWGQFQGRTSLAQHRPYALTASGLFSHGADTVRLDAQGTLARVDLHASAAAAGGQADAKLLLTPFAPIVLAEAHVSGRRLDPAALNGQWPRAALDLDANLAGQPGTSLSGEVALRNARSGPLDRNLLPLRMLNAHIVAAPQRIRLDALRLDLDRAGQFTGEGTFEDGGLTLALRTGNLDPKGLYSRMRSLRLAGAVSLQAGPGWQALTADLSQRSDRLVLDVGRKGEVVRLNRILLGAGGGRLDLNGRLRLDASRLFFLAGKLQYFDPAEFGDYPSAGINASISGEGRLSPWPEGRLQFAIGPSSLRHRPLSGHGELHLAEHRLWDSDVALDLAGNRLDLHGAYGRPGDRLDFGIHANRLGAIDPALAGRIEGQCTLAGTPDAPAGQIQLDAEALAWGRHYRLRRLHADGRLEPAAHGTARLSLNLAGLAAPEVVLNQATVEVEGRRDRHRIRLAALGGTLDLAAELAGGWHAVRGGAGFWAGQVVRLHNSGRYPVDLKSAATLEAGRDRLHVANADLDLLGGVFDLAEFDERPGHFASRGQFSRLPLSALARFGALPKEVGGDLRLEGDWDVQVADRVDGQVSLRRQSGDLVIAAEPALPLGLTGLSLAVEARNDAVSADLDASGSVFGRLKATGDTRLSRRAGRWGVAGAAPIRASADIAIRSLAWASPLVERNGAIQLTGSLLGRLQAIGTVAAPQLSGTLAGQGMGLSWPDQGLNFKDGAFQAELKRDSVELTRLVLHGGDGLLTGRGRLTLARPEMQLALNADKLQVISRPDRVLVLSGTGQAVLSGQKLRVDASLKADRGQFELPRNSTPQVSSDVVVLGRPAPPSPEARLAGLDLDLALDLGEHVSVTGRGMNAQLGGTLRITKMDNGVLKGNGTIRVVGGTYYAYGQQLSIERGLVNFQGPLDDPGLNIVAMRKNQDVEAGVAITGSTQKPVIKLVSNPTVPDSEKLSWLVLGHGLSDASSREMDSLQLAAGAILGQNQSVPLQQRIATAVGLNELSLRGTGTLAGTVVSLGKRLSAKTYVTFEQGLAGSKPVMKINYSLTKRLSVSTQAGSVPAVDLFYSFSFD